ncbi:MAG TPA: AAA family ATPase [Victivallales bacterium]|nr:AAA family ATPase [Victivallales bacterium]
MNNNNKYSKLSNLEKHINSKIIGQYEVIPKLVETLRIGEMGLADKDRPKGSFLFLGPPGVGKTETVKVFTEYLFGNDHLYRFDMSEYMHFDSVKEFRGDETGSSGRLGQILNANKYGTLLFDEMEKAHKQIMDLFLQILDAARITLGNGETYDLHNYYIVFTSNIGAKEINPNIKNIETMYRAIQTEISKQLRREFIDRLSLGICIFKNLSIDEKDQIALNIFNNELNRLKEKGYYLDYEDNAFLNLKERGISKEKGIRMLRDIIQRSINGAICDCVIDKQASGSGTLYYSKNENKIKIKNSPL